MKRKKYFLLFLIICFQLTVTAQNFELNKIEPPNWWAKMKHNKIQLMLYGKGLNNLKASFNTDLISIDSVYSLDNSSYAFIDITLSKKVTPGNFTLTISKGNDKINWNFPVLKREDKANRFTGFNTSDVIYLITPDRFANGDSSNDYFPNMNEIHLPGSDYGRHGGDIKGLIDHLDYIKELGVSAIWINPLLENKTETSYHGYAATDLYNIDPRFGSNKLFKRLVDEAHKRKLKIIFDHINNHIGIFHPWISNLPMNDWLNGSVENHFITTHEKISIYDIHADSSVRAKTINGWFVDEMPDLNQKNPFLAKYLIQNTIWWIQYAGLDGIREDTYYYSDQKFLADWAKEIFYEYPNFNIVGEVLITDSEFLAPYQSGSFYPKKFDTNLPTMFDFPLWREIRNVFERNQSVNNLYKTIAKDFLFSNADNLITFGDNHDSERILYYVKNDLRKFKSVITFLMTTRGIPLIYYGTEIGLIGDKDHGRIREDFPGGFKNSTHNAFNPKQRTKRENEIFEFVKNIIKLRKENSALSEGKLIHLPPSDEVYTYFRISEAQIIMVVLNHNNSSYNYKIPRNLIYFRGIRKLKNLLNKKIVELKTTSYLKLDPMSTSIFELLSNE